MTSAEASDAFPGRQVWNGRNFFALGSALVAVFVLLAVIPYGASYETGKASLFRMFIGTFWGDLVNQVTGLFSAGPKETLAGETTASEFTYCGAVPFIVAWLVWQLWPKLRATPVEGSDTGYTILSIGFLLYIAGFLMENYYIGMGAMEFVYAGLIVLFLGWAMMRELVFPWAFIMFMWPYNFLEDLALELRLLMSWLGHHVLQVIGVPNILKGTAILSPPDAVQSFGIDIADPCSGIRSLFALVMVAAVFAFMTFDKLRYQAIIIALAVPLVIVGNLVRIVILTLATIHFGSTFALGTDIQPSWFHEGAGYLVYLINFGGLLLIGSALSRFIASREGHART